LNTELSSKNVLLRCILHENVAFVVGKLQLLCYRITRKLLVFRYPSSFNKLAGLYFAITVSSNNLDYDFLVTGLVFCLDGKSGYRSAELQIPPCGRDDKWRLALPSNSAYGIDGTAGPSLRSG
jgi:hypothetical protein